MSAFEHNYFPGFNRHCMSISKRKNKQNKTAHRQNNCEKYNRMLIETDANNNTQNKHINDRSAGSS